MSDSESGNAMSCSSDPDESRSVFCTVRLVDIHIDDAYRCCICSEHYHKDENTHCNICRRKCCPECFELFIHNDECDICGQFRCYDVDFVDEGLHDESENLCGKCRDKQNTSRHCATCGKSHPTLALEYCVVDGLLHCEECIVYHPEHEVWVAESNSEDWACVEYVPQCDRCDEMIIFQKKNSCVTTTDILLCEWVGSESMDCGYKIVVRVAATGDDETPPTERIQTSDPSLSRLFSTLRRHRVGDQEYYSCPMCGHSAFEQLEEERYKCKKCSFGVMQCSLCQNKTKRVDVPRQYRMYVQVSSYDNTTGVAVYCGNRSSDCVTARHRIVHKRLSAKYLGTYWYDAPLCTGKRCTEGVLDLYKLSTGNKDAELCNSCTVELNRGLRSAKKKSANFGITIKE